MKKELLYIRNIRGKYKDRITLDNVSFRIYEGEIICVLGYGNAGKSALFKLLGGIPLTGKWDMQLYRAGQKLCIDSVAQARRNGIVLVGDHPGVFPKISVERNMYLLSQKRNNLIRRSRERSRFADVLKRFDLSYPLQKPLEQMKTTDQFIVEILGAYLYGAKMILLDCTHHFTGKTEREIFRRVVMTLREEGIAVLYSSSTVDEDGETFSDRILLMHEGMKMSELTPEQYLTNILDAYHREKVIPQIHENAGIAAGRSPFLYLEGIDNSESSPRPAICRGGLLTIFSRHNTAFERILKSLRNETMGEVRLVHAEGRQTAVSSEWLNRHCCIIETLEPNWLLFDLNISVIDNICLCMDGMKMMRPDIRRALRRSNRDLIELAEKQHMEDRLTALTAMKILKQRILLGSYELCIFVKPERGLDPVETMAVYEEIMDLAQHEIACIVMTDDETIFERYKHLEYIHQ